MNSLNPFLVLSGCYSLLFLFLFWIWKMKSADLVSPKVRSGNWSLLHLRHAGGIIIMVLIPSIILPGISEGLLAWPQHIDNIQVMTVMVTGIVLLIVSAKEADKIENKKISKDRWSLFHAVLHMIFRNSFLVGYEWFFRGIVLFSCVTFFGLIPAVIINIVLYACIHSFNGRKEFLGSIPLGIILCVFTLWWQSVWPAIMLHVLLSSSYESVILHQFFCKPSKIVL